MIVVNVANRRLKRQRLLRGDLQRYFQCVESRWSKGQNALGASVEIRAMAALHGGRERAELLMELNQAPVALRNGRGGMRGLGVGRRFVKPGESIQRRLKPRASRIEAKVSHARHPRRQLPKMTRMLDKCLTALGRQRCRDEMQPRS